MQGKALVLFYFSSVDTNVFFFSLSSEDTSVAGPFNSHSTAVAPYRPTYPPPFLPTLLCFALRPTTAAATARRSRMVVRVALAGMFAHPSPPSAGTGSKRHNQPPCRWLRLFPPVEPQLSVSVLFSVSLGASQEIK